MIEQIVVQDLIQRAVTEHESDVFLQRLAVLHTGFQGLQQLLLPWGQLVGIFRIYRRKILVAQLIGLPFQFDRPVLKVDLVQQKPVFQSVFRMLLDALTFHFELTDRDGLVHLGRLALGD